MRLLLQHFKQQQERRSKVKMAHPTKIPLKAFFVLDF